MKKDPTNNQELAAVLAKINSAVDDFATRPARNAYDQGAFLDYPLHKVAIWGDLKAAETLIEHGADVNALGEDDDTALHRAAAAGHVEMVELLLSRGADRTIRNRYGDSPVDEVEGPNASAIIAAIRGKRT